MLIYVAFVNLTLQGSGAQRNGRLHLCVSDLKGGLKIIGVPMPGKKVCALCNGCLTGEQAY